MTNEEICKGLKDGDDVLVKNFGESKWRRGIFISYHNRSDKVIATIGGAHGIFNWDMIEIPK